MKTRTRFETATYSLPVYWASYLINGDASGLEGGEQETIDTWLSALPFGWQPVDVREDYSFRSSNDAGTLAGDCADYTFIRPRKSPVIRLTLPPSGSIPVSQAQLFALGFTVAEINAGEKRLDVETQGPWSLVSRLSGIVERGEFRKDGSSRMEWVEFYPARAMSRPRQSGYDMEGHLSLNGKKHSAFTSSQMFELPDGHLVDCTVLFARS